MLKICKTPYTNKLKFLIMIFREKTIDDKLKYTLNFDKQNFFVCGLKLLVEKIGNFKFLHITYLIIIFQYGHGKHSKNTQKYISIASFSLGNLYWSVD